MAVTPTYKFSRSWLAGAAVMACAVTGFSLGVSGCNPAADCVSNEEYFQEQVWTAFMEENCFACHNEQGQAKHTQFILRGAEWPGYIEQNLAVLENLARIELDGKPYLLAKPTQDGIDHEGGLRFEEGSDEFKVLAENKLDGGFMASPAVDGDALIERMRAGPTNAAPDGRSIEIDLPLSEYEKHFASPKFSAITRSTCPVSKFQVRILLSFPPVTICCGRLPFALAIAL